MLGIILTCNIFVTEEEEWRRRRRREQSTLRRGAGKNYFLKLSALQSVSEAVDPHLWPLARSFVV